MATAKQGANIGDTVYDPVYKMVEGGVTYTMRLGTATDSEKAVFDGTLSTIPDMTDMSYRRNQYIYWNASTPKPPYPANEYRQCWLIFEVDGVAVGSFAFEAVTDADQKETLISQKTAILEAHRGKKYSTKMFNLLSWMAKDAADGHNVVEINQDILAHVKPALKEAHKRGGELVQTDQHKFSDGPSHKIKLSTEKGAEFRTAQGLSSSNYSIQDRNTAITDAKWATADITREAQANINQNTTPPAWNADWV